SYHDLSTFDNMDRLITLLIFQEDGLGKDIVSTLGYSRLDAIIKKATDLSLSPEKVASAERAIERYGIDIQNYIEVQAFGKINVYSDVEHINFSLDEIRELTPEKREEFNAFVNDLRVTKEGTDDFIRYHSNDQPDLDPNQQKALGLP